MKTATKKLIDLEVILYRKIQDYYLGLNKAGTHIITKDDTIVETNNTLFLIMKDGSCWVIG